MKRCPNCQKEYPDSMRFCQTDGTPLVEAAENAPPPDPYKTVVGGMIKMDEELLQIPEPPDPMKTMISPMSAPKPEAPKAEPPKPAAESPQSEQSRQENKAPETPKVEAPVSNPPSFSESKSAPPPASVASNPPSGGEPPKADTAPPPKPFNDIPKIDSAPPKFNSPYTSGESEKKSSPFDKPQSAPGSSPFDKPQSAPSSSPFDKTPPPPYKQAEPFGGKQPPPFGSSPFEQPQTPFGQSNQPANDAFQQDSWTPPPAPVAGWQDQGLGADTPFQPPVAGGENNTLALISLVLGILSFVCLGIFAGVPAIITGYMQRNNIKNNPSQYGGGGMAMAGMILGGINVALTVIVFVIYAILIFANM